ncbi:hypothetical protein MTR67_027313, partial [Solanum verrucosum]
AACPNTKRSVTGNLVKFGSSLVSWKWKKQQAVSRSSAEAEYRSMVIAIAKITWLLGLFQELRVKVTINSDSKVSLQIASDPIFHERTKHIEINCHFIRDKIKEGLIKTTYIRTEDQQVDVLSKGLIKVQHLYLISKLRVFNILHPPS